MVREISAGGVVVRCVAGAWNFAAIQPRREPLSAASGAKKKSPYSLLALPKGLLDPGEKPDQTALREVLEETGVTASLITKLGDIKYFYVRSWGDGERVFKIVSFYLLQYEAGEIDTLSEDMRVEVARALWVPLADAPTLLAYKGEQQMARQALEYLETHAGV